jgi:coproporphyrinogen III oxidase-like Fe-S oxidoreductase
MATSAAVHSRGRSWTRLQRSRSISRFEPFNFSTLRLLNLYVHFPFCRSRCSYCSLYSRAGSAPTARAEYVESLRVKLESLRVRLESTLTDPNRPYPTLSDNNPTLKTLYFGGGSPALCDLSPLHVPLKQWKTGQTCFPLFGMASPTAPSSDRIQSS